jgi:hypothetical protein
MEDLLVCDGSARTIGGAIEETEKVGVNVRD